MSATFALNRPAIRSVVRGSTARHDTLVTTVADKVYAPLSIQLPRPISANVSATRTWAAVRSGTARQ